MMSRRLFLALLLLSAPLGTVADRGALSVEAGGLLSVARVPAAVGTGDTVLGSIAGGTLGLRYGLRNDVDVTVSGDWFTEAPFYSDGTIIATSNGDFSGQLQSRVRKMGLALGADYVRGLLFRLHAGAEVGWCRIAFNKLDLIDVRDPSNAHSYGLQLGSRTVNGLLIAPRVGIEWAASDRLSFAVTPRLEVILGEPRMMTFTIPLTIWYSWYAVFRPG